MGCDISPAKSTLRESAGTATQAHREHSLPQKRHCHGHSPPETWNSWTKAADFPSFLAPTNPALHKQSPPYCPYCTASECSWNNVGSHSLDDQSCQNGELFQRVWSDNQQLSRISLMFVASNPIFNVFLTRRLNLPYFYKLVYNPINYRYIYHKS